MSWKFSEVRISEGLGSRPTAATNLPVPMRNMLTTLYLFPYLDIWNNTVVPVWLILYGCLKVAMSNQSMWRKELSQNSELSPCPQSTNLFHWPLPHRPFVLFHFSRILLTLFPLPKMYLSPLRPPPPIGKSTSHSSQFSAHHSDYRLIVWCRVYFHTVYFQCCLLTRGQRNKKSIQHQIWSPGPRNMPNQASLAFKQMLLLPPSCWGFVYPPTSLD